MPLDPEVSDLLKTQIVAGNQRGGDLNGVIDRNLVQALGVVQNLIVQSQGATADDSQLFGSLRTAPYVPVGDAKLP